MSKICSKCNGRLLVEDSRPGHLLPFSYNKKILKCEDCGMRYSFIEFMVGEAHAVRNKAEAKYTLEKALINKLIQLDTFKELRIAINNAMKQIDELTE